MKPSSSQFLQRLAPIPAVGLFLTFVVVLNRDLPGRLLYPPVADQQFYLSGGKALAEHFIFLWRAPVYSVWLGGLYLLSGSNLTKTFYVEKIVSVILLALLTARLGYELFDLRTAVLLGVWVLNCKYFLLETNSSHTLAASLWVVSALFLCAPNARVGVPFAFLTLFLSTQARSEMWIPLLAVAAWLGARCIQLKLKQPRGDHRRAFWQSYAYWIVAIISIAALSLLFSARSSPPEEHRLAVAFGQNFSANYVERLNLQQRFPDPWREWQQVWAEALPNAATPLAALRLYPAELFRHFLYNVKLLARAFPANVVAFDRPVLMALVLLIYLASYGLWGSTKGYLGKWKSLSDEARLRLIVWAVALFALIPISLVLRVAARYYIQLIPIQLLAVAFVTQAIGARLSAARAPR